MSLQGAAKPVTARVYKGNKGYFARGASHSKGLKGVRVTKCPGGGDKMAQVEYISRLIYIHKICSTEGQRGGRGLAWERGGAGGSMYRRTEKGVIGNGEGQEGLGEDTGRAEGLSQLGEMGEDGRGLEDAEADERQGGERDGSEHVDDVRGRERGRLCGRRWLCLDGFPIYGH